MKVEEHYEIHACSHDDDSFILDSRCIETLANAKAELRLQIASDKKVDIKGYKYKIFKIITTTEEMNEELDNEAL